MNKLFFSFFIIIFVFCATSCRHKTHSLSNSVENIKPQTSSSLDSQLVDRCDTCGLILLYPKFDKVDLVCGNMPSVVDKTVILCAEAAYTGECLKSFTHKNIACDHVSGGVRYKGTPNKRNTGAFIYVKGKWKFLYDKYSDEMTDAANGGGAAFAQEMLIHKRECMTTVRKDVNRNQFRALCQIKDRLCVAESKSIVSLGEFKDSLLKVGTSEALYLDMGEGWNHAWYRKNKHEVIVLHRKRHNYCTNWITFYSK